MDTRLGNLAKMHSWAHQALDKALTCQWSEVSSHDMTPKLRQC